MSKKIIFIVVFLFILFMLALISLFTGIGIHTVYKNVATNNYDNYSLSSSSEPNFDYKNRVAMSHQMTYFGIFKPACANIGFGSGCSEKIDVWLTLRNKDIPLSKKCEISYNEKIIPKKDEKSLPADRRYWQAIDLTGGTEISYDITCLDNYGMKSYTFQFADAKDLRIYNTRYIKELMDHNVTLPTKDNPLIEIIPEN